jgi:hypothetical protein
MAPATRSSTAVARARKADHSRLPSTNQEGEPKDAATMSATGQGESLDVVQTNMTEEPRQTTVGAGEMEADASRQAVLQTNELLESILSFLPQKDLFVVGRVSKSWRAAIVGSLGMRRKMMLRLDDATRQTWEVVFDDPYDKDPDHPVHMSRVDVDPVLVPSGSYPRYYVKPVQLGPYFEHYHYQSDNEYDRIEGGEETIFLDPLRGVALGSHISLTNMRLRIA